MSEPKPLPERPHDCRDPRLAGLDGSSDAAAHHRPPTSPASVARAAAETAEASVIYSGHGRHEEATEWPREGNQVSAGAREVTARALAELGESVPAALAAAELVEERAEAYGPLARSLGRALLGSLRDANERLQALEGEIRSIEHELDPESE